MNPLFEIRCLFFGCGNPLLGDDGLGPQVMERLLADHALPEWVDALDVGAAISRSSPNNLAMRGHLFSKPTEES